jgi:sporulation protein YlmC with PRC-barrel domain
MILRALTTLVDAIFLMEIVLGKEVITPEGDTLGRATDIKIDFKQGQIWVLIKDKEDWLKISSKQISSCSKENIPAESCFMKMTLA